MRECHNYASSILILHQNKTQFRLVWSQICIFTRIMAWSAYSSLILYSLLSGEEKLGREVFHLGEKSSAYWVEKSLPKTRVVPRKKVKWIDLTGPFASTGPRTTRPGYFRAEDHSQLPTVASGPVFLWMLPVGHRGCVVRPCESRGKV